MHSAKRAHGVARLAHNLKLPKQHDRSTHADAPAAPRPVCSAKDLHTQTGSLPGSWVMHEDPAWQSYHGASENCPEWAGDFDCLKGEGTEKERNSALARHEYRKIFRPDQ
jgi:hypothetical protein